MTIEIEIPDEVAALCEALGLNLAQVVADRLFWSLTRPVLLEETEF